MKEKQGTIHQEAIPSLSKQDGTTATSSRETEVPGELFYTKMAVPDPSRHLL